MRALESASFWRENMIAVVMAVKQVIYFLKFYRYAIGSGLTPVNKNKLADSSTEKKHNEVFPGVYFFEIIRKT